MNWQVPDLVDKAIVSFSDAHSLPRLGRELTVFQGQPTFLGLHQGLTLNRVEFTVEMYPEEGKYHFDGHRKCGVSVHPDNTIREGDACPQCGRPLTLGVLHRSLDLQSEGADVQSGRAQPHLNAGATSLPTNAVLSEAARPPFVRMSTSH